MSNTLKFPATISGGIVASWVISPVLSGLIGAATFVLTDKVILGAVDPRQTGALTLTQLCANHEQDPASDVSQPFAILAILALPILFSTVTFVVIFSVMIKAQQTKVTYNLFPSK